MKTTLTNPIVIDHKKLNLFDRNIFKSFKSSEGLIGYYLDYYIEVVTIRKYDTFYFWDALDSCVFEWLSGMFDFEHGLEKLVRNLFKERKKYLKL